MQISGRDISTCGFFLLYYSLSPSWNFSLSLIWVTIKSWQHFDFWQFVCTRFHNWKVVKLQTMRGRVGRGSKGTRVRQTKLSAQHFRPQKWYPWPSNGVLQTSKASWTLPYMLYFRIYFWALFFQSHLLIDLVGQGIKAELGCEKCWVSENMIDFAHPTEGKTKIYSL